MLLYLCAGTRWQRLFLTPAPVGRFCRVRPFVKNVILRYKAEASQTQGEAREGAFREAVPQGALAEGKAVEDALFIYITAPDKATARELGKTLVRERLAACADILDGVESLYWWRGEIQEDVESVCILKTTADGYKALEKRVRELHPYEIPCIVALPLVCGHAPFLRWITEETRPTTPD